MPYTIPQSGKIPDINNVRSADEDGDDADVEGEETFRREKEPAQELGTRTSTFSSLLPGEVGQRLKAVIWGRAAVEDSDDLENSGETDSAASPGSTGAREPDHEAAMEESQNKTIKKKISTQRHDVKNYNTFGWDSDVENIRNPDTAHVA